MFLLFIFSASPAFAQTDTNALPALAPAYGELPPTFWQHYETPIFVGSFALLAVAFLFLRVLLRPETPVILPPEVLACRTLTKLQPRPEDGKLLSEVSQVLRRFVGAVCNFQGAQMTTAEFAAALTGGAKISPQLAEALLTLLCACDKDKFAARNAAPPLNAVGRALELVARIENETRRRDAGAPSA